MSFCAFPVFLAFILNRCSIRFFTSCRCVLGFTPFSASLLFGFSLVAILIKHPELYPCWLRKVDVKIMFLYELIVSLIFIEIGFCLWNSVETFMFYRIPAFLEDHCSSIGEFYIQIVETPVGVSLISNILASLLLFFTLHTTRVCNFNLLLRNNGIHKFFADAGLTSQMCRHRREIRMYKDDDDICIKRSDQIIPQNLRMSPRQPCIRGPKILRSKKDFIEENSKWEKKKNRKMK